MTKELNISKNLSLLSNFSNDVLISRDYDCPKIDLFSDGKYICSTEGSKTLKLAKARLLDKYWFWFKYSSTKITAKFYKDGR